MYQALSKYFALPEDEFSGHDLLCEVQTFAQLNNSKHIGKSTPVIDVFRERFASEYCCAVPSPEILKLIAEQSPLIEVGAGNGYWAKELAQLGADVIALDTGLDFKPKYFEVSIPDTNLFKSNLHRTLLLVWPSEDLDWPRQLIADYEWSNIIYIGEWRGGRMANNGFFDELERNYEIANLRQMPRYPGWRDSCYFFRRKASNFAEC